MNPKPISRVKAFWREWRTVAVFLIVMILFRSAIADWNQVPSGSMQPTILEGDRIVVNKLAYDLKIPFTTRHLLKWDEPQPGDIVTFYSPRDEKLLVKRIIGAPGDIVAMTNNRLHINGEPASYRQLDAEVVKQLDSYDRINYRFFFEQFEGVDHPIMIASNEVPLKQSASVTNYNSFAALQIPPGYYLMLGDNRDHSSDSRVLGLVSRQRIIGRAHTVAFSVDYEDYYLPRMDRFVRPLQ